MCLSKITKVYDEDDVTSGVGWKIISCSNSDWGLPQKCSINSFFTPVRRTVHPYDKHLLSASPLINSLLNGKYKSGFHIFKTRKAARNHWIYEKRHKSERIKIVKVNYKGILYEGLDDGCATLVIKEMFVPKEQIRA